MTTLKLLSPGDSGQCSNLRGTVLEFYTIDEAVVISDEAMRKVRAALDEPPKIDKSFIHWVEGRKP